MTPTTMEIQKCFIAAKISLFCLFCHNLLPALLPSPVSNTSTFRILVLKNINGGMRPFKISFFYPTESSFRFFFNVGKKMVAFCFNERVNQRILILRPLFEFI